MARVQRCASAQALPVTASPGLMRRSAKSLTMMHEGEKEQVQCLFPMPDTDNDSPVVVVTYVFCYFMFLYVGTELN